LALVLQLKAMGITDSVTTVLNLAPGMRIPSCQFLFELVGMTSDEVILIGDSKLYLEAEEIFKNNKVAFNKIFLGDGLTPPKGLRYVYKKIRARRDRSILNDLIGRVGSGYTLLRSHADVGPVSKALCQATRDRGGQVFVYLEGCYPPFQSLPINYFSTAKPELADLFLLYSSAHKQVLADVGYTNFYTIGYTKLFPAWKNAVKSSQSFRRYNRSPDITEVSLFTRGEYIGGGPQILPNHTLRSILLNIFDVLLSDSSKYRIRIKPHPAQDANFIEKLIGDRMNIELSCEHPAVLAATSDIVITTWSTSVIDSLVFKVPSIEYFIENDYFLSVYPHGSSFRQLGIETAYDRLSFEACIQRICGANYQVPDIDEKLSHRMDLEIFKNYPL